ncbi:hypothetical protein ACPCKZ_13390 [Streptomyces pseudogriseolus]|uniref:hypothetical protein n=1 Tax=Streptomyces pseudogriseolus TaxID=36817 RepID=UPI003FA34130
MAMGADPSEDEVRAALDAQLARCNGKGSGRTAADFSLTRLHLLDASITRYVEQRTEATRHEPGAVHLADRPVYDVLRDHELGPDEKPLDKPLDLVRRGTVHIRSCGCGNGRQQCPDCKGMTYRTCEPAQPCPVCEGVSPCSQYLKHGGLPGTPPRPPKARKAANPEERVTCDACHTPDSACPGCRGWGRVKCERCQARGRIPCGPCKATGTVTCGTCKGHGRTTSWTAGRIVWERRTEKVTHPDPWPRRVANDLGAGDWRTDRLGAGDPLPEDLSDDHRAVLAPHLRKLKGEQDRTVVIKRLTVVRATPRGSGNRDYYLFRGCSGKLEVLARISDEGRGKAVAAAVAAVVLLVLVLLLVN